MEEALVIIVPLRGGQEDPPNAWLSRALLGAVRTRSRRAALHGRRAWGSPAAAAPRRRRDALAGSPPVQPPLRVYASLSRPQGWWEAFRRARRGESDWRHHFGVSPATFAELVASLEGRLQAGRRSAAPGRLSAEKRVALTLSHLASGDPFEALAAQFGVEPSAVAEAVVEVCSAIEEELLRKVVRLPPDVTEVMDGFSRLGIPHCIGAVDEISFRLPASEAAPESSALANVYSSVVLQGTVDHRGRFIHVAVALADRITYGSFLLLGSALCTAMDAGALVPGNPTLTLGGVAVPPLVVADWAYGMRRWLMTPYRLCPNQCERHFNRTVSQVHYIAKHALMQLKSRWKCLTAPFQLRGADARRMVASCVVLHNVCEENGQGPPLAQRTKPEPLVEFVRGDPSGLSDLQEGKMVRDAVARYMLATLRHHLEEETGG